MASIQLRLQRELFDPNGEQLLAMVHCVQPNPKKQGRTRDVYLCVINHPEQSAQFNIQIAELRAPAAPEDANAAGEAALPKRKRGWSIKQLRAVDAKHEDSAGIPGASMAAATLDFQLEFSGEKAPYAWTATSDEERKKFLSTLINLAARHSQKQRISLSNLPPDIIVMDDLKASESGASGGGSTTGGARGGGDGTERKKSDLWGQALLPDEAGVYEPISAKEAGDLMQLMTKCEHSVTNADIFVEDLTAQLSALDDSNISSILQSEENIERLMGLLEGAIHHTSYIESRLNQYDDFMEHIRDSLDKMEGKTVSLETINANNKKLYATLESAVLQLDLSFKNQSVLNEADFSSSKKLRECTLAARALQKALNADIDPHLHKMAAVQDQVKRCEKLRDKFAKNVARHLSNLFIHMGNDTESLSAGSAPAAADELKLKRRKRIHRELMKFAELVHWLKAMDEKNYLALQSIYRENLSKLYEKDIRAFFELARFRVSGGRPPAPTVAGSVSDLAGVVTGAAKKGSKTLFAHAGPLLGGDTDSIASNLSLSERERFDEVLETVLIELEDICMDEQFFSVNFFKMEQIDATNPDPKKDRKVMEEARSMMAEIFPSLENELLQFIAFYERSDAFFTLHALVRLSKHVLSTQDTGSFLAISFGTVLVQIKRNFDKFMQIQVQSITEAKPPKRAKCGILPFVANFDGFLKTTEAIFKASERRSDLEKWYTSFVLEMSKSIVRISREHGKTPAEVIKMENYHHLHGLLSQKKIAALDPMRKDLKELYKTSQNEYVIQYFGRPLEKLNLFFEGIQQLVAAGVKESEISYQLDYSKQKLRQVILAYPGKEVRKGLDSLYKKVEKHLSEEENLIQVVWRAMQEEFIRQYKNIDALIERCYPGAQIALDFSIDEILEYFSEIARSH